jgi:virginiamycin B lyase
MRTWVVAAALALAVAPAANAAPSLFTLSDPSGKLDSPASIAAGPDQTMWIANAGPLHAPGPERFAIGRVDLAGRFRLYRTKGETYGIAVLPDGTAFATEPYRSRIARIGLDGRVTEFPTPTPDAGPTAIAAGPDGNAWFAESAPGGGAAVGRITPAGTIEEFPVPRLPYLETTVAADVGPIVAGPGDRLWFTTGLGVGSVTTDGDVVTFALPEPASPAGIAAGADGALWVTESALPRIDRLTSAGESVPLALPDDADGVSLAAAPDGAMYFTQSAAHTLWRATGDALERIDLQLVDRVKRTARAQPLAVTENGGAPGMAAGPAGTLWIAATLTRKGGSKGGIAVVNPGGSCIVPDLTGDTLSLARLDVANHACALAPVQATPRARIACQYPPAGTVLDHGALVSATFGRADCGDSRLSPRAPGLRFQHGARPRGVPRR